MMQNYPLDNDWLQWILTSHILTTFNEVNIHINTLSNQKDHQQDKKRILLDKRLVNTDSMRL